MGEEISVLICATDEASSVIAEASEQIDASLSEVGESADAVGSEITDAMGSASDSMEQAQCAVAGLQSKAEEAADATTQVAAASLDLASAQDSASGSMKSAALGMSSFAMSGATLVMSVSTLENAEVSLDRAHVTVEKDTNAVQSAQEKYNEAVAKYGPNSQQATDAANKLQAAQNALTVAQERVNEAQRNVNNSIMMSAISVVPTIISGITGLSAAFTAFGMTGGIVTGVVDGLNMAMAFLAANPIVLVVAGIAALAIGLYEAYEHCAPFRNAVNEIGAALGGALKTAVDDIYNGLKFLWNDVLVPIANFLKTVFLDALNVVLEPLKLITGAVSAIGGVGKAIGGALGGIGKALGLAEGGIVTEPTFALVGEAGPEAVIPLNENFGDALNDVNGGQIGAANSGSSTVNEGNQTVTIQMTTNPTISIGQLSGSASVQDIISAVTSAVNSGMAQPLVDALNRAFAAKQQRRSGLKQ